ncbi:MAG: DUF3240 family protein [Rhodoplanes sp.]|uniref:DUF3240 family protein n=1 Tax=Rhodoplanes sp. TaxID=1968906 RepID=UPI00184CA409|nr:DUF3240 family protein [Rhodoplanes sp.]NVO17385.1 DUF3240 family protein [Rhodoplanes sp.]
MTLAALVLLIPAALEEEVVDRMLDHDSVARAGFITRDVRFHGDAAAYQSVIEQVRGYTRVVEITVTLPEPDLRRLLASVSEALPGRGISYRIVPIAEASTL